MVWFPVMCVMVPLLIACAGTITTSRAGTITRVIFVEAGHRYQFRPASDLVPRARFRSYTVVGSGAELVPGVGKYHHLAWEL